MAPQTLGKLSRDICHQSWNIRDFTRVISTPHKKLNDPKCEEQGDLVTDTGPRNKWSVRISDNEIREVYERLKWAIAAEELAALGHILLEINGSERTWVTSNGTVTLSMRTSGEPVKSSVGTKPLRRVLIHGRMFNRFELGSGVIEVIDWGKYRELEFHSNGLATRFVESPEVFPDWKRTFTEADGPTVSVCPRRLRDGVIQAATVPVGVNMDDRSCHTWVHGADGALRFRTPWVSYFDTEVDISAHTSVPDTPAALIDLHSLQSAIHLMDEVAGDVTVTLSSSPMSPMRLRAAEFDAVITPTDRWVEERNTLTSALCTILRVDAIQPDEDGDYPITQLHHSIWARLNTSRKQPIVQVFSILANGVPKCQELFEELNSINRIEHFVRLVWTGSSLGAEASLLITQVDAYTLDFMFREVQRVTKRYQEMLAAFFAEPDQTETLF